MQQVELIIDGKAKLYKLPLTIADMPINRYLAWQEVVGEQDNPGPRQVSRALAAILGADAKDIGRADAAQVLQVLKACEAYITNTEPQPQEVDGFDFEGVYYAYPASPVNAINLERQPLKGSTFEQWEDAQNLIHDFHSADEQLGRLRAMPWVMAVYCLPKGISKDEETQETLEKRGIAFQSLPMQCVYDFAFFLTRRKPIWMSVIASLSQSLARKVKSLTDD